MRSIHTVLVLLLCRGLPQLCVGIVQRGSGWVLLTERLPTGSHLNPVGPSLFAVRLWWFHQRLLPHQPPRHGHETHWSPHKRHPDPEQKEGRGVTLIVNKDTVYIYISFFLLWHSTSSVYLQAVPPYNGFGSLEDSLQNCLSLIPKPPKKNVLKMLENDHKVLRYSARLVSPQTLLWLIVCFCICTTVKNMLNPYYFLLYRLGVYEFIEILWLNCKAFRTL